MCTATHRRPAAARVWLRTRLQSVGVWRGLLLFSVLAGVIGAYGLIFDVGNLLVAAMLVNPMGAPALVAVVAIAIGGARMFLRGGARFGVSLLAQAAAVLAPPAAVLGLAVPLGRWDYAGLMAFLLVLQFVAIAAGGWLSVHAVGVRPAEPGIGRGSAPRRTALVAAVTIVMATLVLWQAHARDPAAAERHRDEAAASTRAAPASGRRHLPPARSGASVHG